MRTGLEAIVIESDARVIAFSRRGSRTRSVGKSRQKVTSIASAENFASPW